MILDAFERVNKSLEVLLVRNDDVVRHSPTMAEATTTTDEDNDELVCPITMEVFRDPVLAGDGRVYEREAITRWIFEHGTSPFTREPLQLDQLQPDDRLRQLASKRRNSTVSYHAQTGTVVLPPLRNNRRIYPETYQNPMAPNYHYVPRSRSICRKCDKVTVCAVIIGVFIALSIIIGIIIGVTTSSSTSSFTSPPSKSLEQSNASIRSFLINFDKF